jgi:enamine deaminase RidA (YjgF/YER057c/UK114 family)
MTSNFETRLIELDIILPVAAIPAANYVPYVQSQNLVFIAGQLPVQNGVLKFKGRVGEELSLDEGYEAAHLCGLNILSQLKAACGDLDRVVRCVRLGGFVNSASHFGDQPKVINGASDLMVQVFGDKGKHARAAISAVALPLFAAVEIEAIFEVH